MAKTKSPLLSLSARGQIGKSQVYGTWRGVPYVRQHVIPSNPNTTQQQVTRNTFKALSDLWKLMGTIARAPWDAATTGRPLTNRNQFIKSNLPDLRGEADMALFIGSPGAKGGLPPSAVAAAATVSSGELEVTVTSPAEPTDWTLESISVIAFKDRDPAISPSDFPVEDEDLAPTADGDTVITLTGLDNVLYQASAWTVWTRPDGYTAYGLALTDSATPLA
jgi:hypothetical protein